MFSGIVEEIGLVKKVDPQPGLLTLTIEAKLCLEDLKIGDSIAVNGVCLTVCHFDSHSLTVQAMPETLKRTNLGALVLGAKVNLERSITAATRLGGHFVQGHVDTTVNLMHLAKEGESLKVWFEKPQPYAACFIPKGYIAIDGMSLTLVDVQPKAFSICFIPYTQWHTIVSDYNLGRKVNVEIDHMTKTIVHLVNQRKVHE